MFGKKRIDYLDNVKELGDFYYSKGFRRRIGFGDRPAVLVIDFTRAFTDEKSPIGYNYKCQLLETKKILVSARKARIPVIFTTVEHEPEWKTNRFWLRKQPDGLTEFCVPGTEWVRVDSILDPQPEEVLIRKRYASAFFGTDLLSRLNADRVDTIILTGCVTSGCIRATAVDGISYEFRVIIAEEAVGDRADLSHQVSLIEIDAKYGDVVPANTVIEYLNSLETTKSSL